MERVRRILREIDELFCNGSMEEANTLRDILSAFRGPDEGVEILSAFRVTLRGKLSKQHTVALRRAMFPRLAGLADDKLGISLDAFTMNRTDEIENDPHHFTTHCLRARAALERIGYAVEAPALGWPEDKD